MTTTQPGTSLDPSWTEKGFEHKGAVERMIDTIATGLGTSVAWMAEHGVLFAIFAVLWVVFGAALVLSQGSLDQAWTTIRGLPVIVQALVWVLFLPVMAGLWVWETTWPLVVRLVIVAGVAGWNLFMFLPRALQAARP